MVLKNRDDLINNHYDSHLTAPNDAVGGNKKEWNKFLIDVSLYVKKNFPMMDGKDMVKLAYELNNNYQLENPIKLNPKTATFEKVGSHARRWQRLSLSTIEHRLRCARRMSKHPVFPIDFNTLNYDQFIAYMNHREIEEKASGYALMNDLRTIQMFLRAYHYDLNTWFYKLPTMPRHKKKNHPLSGYSLSTD